MPGSPAEPSRSPSNRQSEPGVAVARHGSAAIVRVTGDIDMARTRLLEESVTKLVAVRPSGLETVITDLSQASTLADAGTAALRAAARACEGTLALRIVATGPALRSLRSADTGGLTVHPRLEQAIAASQAAGPGVLDCAMSTWPTHVLVSVAGECDIITAPRLSDALLSRECRQARRVAVSLAGLRFLDSAGLYALLKARAALGQGGTALALAAPQPPVTKILSLSSAEEILPVYDTLAEAVADG